MSNENDILEMTNGRPADKTWTQDENGNWFASTHDRRRLLLNFLSGAAGTQGGFLTNPQVTDGLIRFSITNDEKDQAEMVRQFKRVVKPA